MPLLVHADSGALDEALDWLTRAVDAGLPAPAFVRMDPLWSGLRDDPEFEQLATRVAERIAGQRDAAEQPWEN